MLDVLAEIQERNKAVKDLEQSLLELHQIFLDMAVLVEAQVTEIPMMQLWEAIHMVPGLSMHVRDLNWT